MTTDKHVKNNMLFRLEYPYIIDNHLLRELC